MNETTLQVQCVHGGFILTAIAEDEVKTEVFTSQGKLLKAVRTLIDEQSLGVEGRIRVTPPSPVKQPKPVQVKDYD